MNMLRVDGSAKFVQPTLRPTYCFFAKCDFCEPEANFDDPLAFLDHLRGKHSAREGGSYTCRYGRTGLCPGLPAEGVNDIDYEAHLGRAHLAPLIGQQKSMEAKLLALRRMYFGNINE
ncbi:unnamed protein product, partial [Mesorhabditis spiculigera]